MTICNARYREIRLNSDKIDSWRCHLEEDHEGDYHGDYKEDGDFSRRWPREDGMESYGPRLKAAMMSENLIPTESTDVSVTSVEEWVELYSYVGRALLGDPGMMDKNADYLEGQARDFHTKAEELENAARRLRAAAQGL